MKKINVTINGGLVVYSRFDDDLFEFTIQWFFQLNVSDNDSTHSIK